MITVNIACAVNHIIMYSHIQESDDSEDSCKNEYIERREETITRNKDAWKHIKEVNFTQ